MLKLIGLASVAASLLFACPFASAQSILRVCNHGDVDLAVMTLVNYHNPLQVLVGVDGWVEDGWKMVKINACESVYEPPMNQPAYIGFVYLTTQGEMRMPVISAGHDDVWIHDVDKFNLCVSANAFNVTDRNVKNLQQCSGARTIPLPLSIYFQPSGNGDYNFSVSPRQSNSVSLTGRDPRPDPMVIAGHRINKPEEPPMSSLPAQNSTPPISLYGAPVIIDWLKVKVLLAAADNGFIGPRFHSQPVDVLGSTWYKTDLQFPGRSDLCLSEPPSAEPSTLFCSTEIHSLEEANSAYQNLWTALNDSALQLRQGLLSPELRDMKARSYSGFYSAYTPHSAYVELTLQKQNDQKYDLVLKLQAPERTVRTRTPLPSRPR